MDVQDLLNITNSSTDWSNHFGKQSDIILESWAFIYFYDPATPYLDIQKKIFPMY